MKKKLFIFVLLFLSFILVGCSNNDCETPKEEKEVIISYGEVVEQNLVEGKKVSIPKLDFVVINGTNAFNAKSSDLFLLNIYDYKLKTTINNKEDVSIWEGVSIKDLFDLYEITGTKLNVSSSNGMISKTYDNIDNLYLLYLKNEEYIDINGDISYVLVDISKPDYTWFYGFDTLVLK